MTMVVESRSAATAVSTVRSRPSGTRITPKVSHSGQHVLSGLASIGVLILLFVSPFSDSGIIMREMPSVSAVAQTPMTQADAAEARPAQDEADQIASIRPQMGDVGQSAEDDASRPTAAVDPRMPAAVALLTVPVYPKALDTVRGTTPHVGRWFGHMRRATAHGYGPLQQTPAATAS